MSALTLILIVASVMLGAGLVAILAWFGYHLKGDAPPDWITKGVTVLDREKELKKTKRETATGTP